MGADPRPKTLSGLVHSPGKKILATMARYTTHLRCHYLRPFDHGPCLDHEAGRVRLGLLLNKETRARTRPCFADGSTQYKLTTPIICTRNFHHSHDTTQHRLSHSSQPFPIPHAKLIGNDPPVPASLSSTTNYPESSPLLASPSSPHAGISPPIPANQPISTRRSDTKGPPIAAQ